MDGTPRCSLVPESGGGRADLAAPGAAAMSLVDTIGVVAGVSRPFTTCSCSV